ncbi:phosphonate ABC transporter, permease protein PhnE [Pseudonocardia sp. GCM10023141]|uniref:phosphonate ABC transporter, permease protein PhnE n=1 Tax=Pseudonocardia sp. GCM10023141 TaxID=3252653 RepID=UPI003616B17B
MTAAARPAKPRTAWKAVVVLAAVVAVTVWAGFGVEVDIGGLIRNFANATDKIVLLTQPDYWFFPQTLPALTQTLQMAVIATAVGAAVALPLSFLASRTTNPSGPVLAVVRSVMNVVRSVPDLLYAAILVSVVGTGALSGTIALVLFNVGIVVKLVSEALDAVDRGPLEAALATGATWPAADRAAVLPQVLPAFASQTLYVLELNVRASTVIGLVGGGGLGILIDQVRTFYRYHQLSLIILEILVVVVVLELLSSWLRKRLVA